MAYLILADGTIFRGKSIGVKGYALGEVVFNTSHTGYQEILTDPSYCGQMISFTTPHIGNVGINDDDYESPKVHASGAIFRDFCNYYSNWKASNDLETFLHHHQVVAISEIDTRALTIILREKGSQGGCIVTDDVMLPAQALELLNTHKSLHGRNLAKKVSTIESFVHANPINNSGHVVVVDCGIKQGILESLERHHLKITVVPQNISFEKVKSLNPDGIIVSNGPGDPSACTDVINLVKKSLKEKIPLFGICLGHQILALAAGGSVKKMKFGHHGANHPIKCHQTGSVFISSQNHGFVVDDTNLPECFEITHSSLFDQTIAGIKHKHAPAFSFQGHPEANPGPKELVIMFQQFIEEVFNAKKHLH